MPLAIAALSGPRLYSSAVNSYSFLTSTPGLGGPGLSYILSQAQVEGSGLARAQLGLRPWLEGETRQRGLQIFIDKCLS